MNTVAARSQSRLGWLQRQKSTGTILHTESQILVLQIQAFCNKQHLNIQKLHNVLESHKKKFLPDTA